MHRTTLAFSEKLLRKAKLKAASEGVTMSEVLRQLLERWASGEVDLRESPGEAARVERALSSFGIWRDRDPDELLEQSRVGLRRRDEELNDAGMGS